MKDVTEAGCADWQSLSSDLSRTAVPGGWLYRTVLNRFEEGELLPVSVAMAFVPDNSR